MHDEVCVAHMYIGNAETGYTHNKYFCITYLSLTECLHNDVVQSWTTQENSDEENNTYYDGTWIKEYYWITDSTCEEFCEDTSETCQIYVGD